MVARRGEQLNGDHCEAASCTKFILTSISHRMQPAAPSCDHCNPAASNRVSSALLDWSWLWLSIPIDVHRPCSQLILALRQGRECNRPAYVTHRQRPCGRLTVRGEAKNFRRVCVIRQRCSPIDRRRLNRCLFPWCCQQLIGVIGECGWRVSTNGSDPVLDTQQRCAAVHRHATQEHWLAHFECSLQRTRCLSTWLDVLRSFH